jgi:hypothetical protein
MRDDHIDMADDHIDMPHPISMIHVPYRYPYRYLTDVRSPISISHIDLPYRSRIISCHSGPRPRPVTPHFPLHTWPLLTILLTGVTRHSTLTWTLVTRLLTATSTPRSTPCPFLPVSQPTNTFTPHIDIPITSCHLGCRTLYGGWGCGGSPTAPPTPRRGGAG